MQLNIHNIKLNCLRRSKFSNNVTEDKESEEKDSKLQLENNIDLGVL